MTNPNSHVQFGSTKNHKKILTGISWKRCLRGKGMNNYWNHEPEFFWYKKKSEKVRNFWLRGQTPPPPSRFFEKIPDVIFLRPLSEQNISNVCVRGNTVVTLTDLSKSRDDLTSKTCWSLFCWSQLLCWWESADLSFWKCWFVVCS